MSSSFKSTSKRPNTSSLSSSSTNNQPLQQQSKKQQNSTQKSLPRRSRSVSAFSRTHLDTTSKFSNKRDNPLFWVDGLPNSEEDIDGFKLSNFEIPDFGGLNDLKGSGDAGGGESRRGRSVSRNCGGETKVSGGVSGGGDGSGGGRGRREFGRSFSRVDTSRRRRSLSRGNCGNSESEREQESESLNFRSKSKINSNANRASVTKRNKLVRSASDLSEILKGRNTWTSQHPSFETSDDSAINLSGSGLPHWEDGISTTSISEAEEKTIKAVSEEKITPLKENDGTAGGILETVRSEVRQAISDMQNDLKNAMIRSNSDAICSSIIFDVAPDLEIAGVVGLVEDFREEFARELEECEERSRKLRAELAVEEHREFELSKILNDIVPEPKTPVVQKTHALRKARFERKKMSKHLQEEALAYFDECVSISTFDESEFSSLEDLPSIVASMDGAGSERVDLPRVSRRVSDACTFETQDDMQRTPVVQCDESSPRRSSLNSSVTVPHTISLEEDIRHHVKSFSKDSGIERSDSHIVQTSHNNTHDYNWEVCNPTEKLLLDRVTFWSRIESGSMLLCGGVGFSVAPFSSFSR